jgi:hypothetical protein
MQLLGVLGRWLHGDRNAVGILTESITHTPRFGVDGDRWVRWHCALLDAFVEAAAKPDQIG